MKAKKINSKRSKSGGNGSPGRFHEVFPDLFPLPAVGIQAALRSLHEWNKSLKTETGPRIVFISTDQTPDPSAFVLPALIASAGVTVPTVLIPPLPFWNRLCRLTGMNLNLSSAEFSRLLHVNQTAVCLPPANIVSLLEMPASKKPAVKLNYLQTVFLLLFLSSPHYAVFDIRIGRERNLMAPDQGFELADKLQKLCGQLRIQSTSILSDFHQPLGQSLGEIFKVREAYDLFCGSGPQDILKLILELGTAGLKKISPRTHPTEIKIRLKNLLLSGKAKEKAEEIIARQGGAANLFDTPPPERGNFCRIEISSPESGYVRKISWTKALTLQRMLEGKHPDSGIVFLKKPGDFVARNECLGEVHIPNGKNGEDPGRLFRGIFTISQKPAAYRPLILGRL